MWRYVPSTMLLAASESAVTKKPRLRFTINRSSSVRPFGFFHRAMSRFMFTSCGIQWFAHPARYFSQAHLYLKGTSWLTSVLALMMRLSSARTRVNLPFTPSPSLSTSLASGNEGGGILASSEGFTICSPRAGVIIGVSSSKLSMLGGFLCFLADRGSDQSHRNLVALRCIRFPVQRLEVFGVALSAQLAGLDEIELPAEGRRSLAVVLVANEVAEAVLAELPRVELARHRAGSRPGGALQVFHQDHLFML